MTSALSQLPARERVALTAAAIGLTNPAAAKHLRISERTYRRALDSAIEHLDAKSTMHAVALAALAGELDPAQVRDRALPSWPARRRDEASRAASAAAAAISAEQRARFAVLRRDGLAVEEAAQRVGVTVAVGRRYERHLARQAVGRFEEAHAAGP